jgi:regulatory protein
MKKITKIEQQKRKKNRVSLYLNETFFCGIPKELIAKLDLFKGKEVDETEIKSLIVEKEIADAKQKVLRLLNRKMYSEKEIRDKLRKKDVEDSISKIVIRDLKEISLIDDYAYTQAFVSDVIRLKPQGSFKIAYELKQKGVRQTIINKVFHEAQIVEEDASRAIKIGKQKLARMKSIKDKKTLKRRLYNFLLRRGFSYEVIRDTLDKVL